MCQHGYDEHAHCRREFARLNNVITELRNDYNALLASSTNERDELKERCEALESANGETGALLNELDAVRDELAEVKGLLGEVGRVVDDAIKAVKRFPGYWVTLKQLQNLAHRVREAIGEG
jgi:chromosome segregation ATPase